MRLPGVAFALGTCVAVVAFAGRSAGVDGLDYEIETLAAPGDEVPLSGGETYGNVSDPSINSQGDIVHVARSPTGRVIFRRSGGTNVLVVREGDPAPGTGGALFSNGYLRALPVTDSREVVFQDRLDSNLDDCALFRYSDSDGTTTLLLRSGDPAPPSIGGTYERFAAYTVNTDGAIVISATIAGGAVSNAILLHTASGVVPLVRVDETPPTPYEATYLGLGIARRNDAGDLVFGASVSLPEPPAPGDYPSADGLFRLSQGQTELIALEGAQVPGWPDVRLTDLSRFGIAGDGAVIFSAWLEHEDDPAGFQGLLRYSHGTVEALLVSSDPPPRGQGPFSSIGGIQAVNEAGDAVFAASWDSDSGLLLWSGGEIVPVALRFDPIPQAGGMTIHSFKDALHMNANGEVVFVAIDALQAKALLLATPTRIQPVPGLSDRSWLALALLMCAVAFAALVGGRGRVRQVKP